MNAETSTATAGQHAAGLGSLTNTAEESMSPTAHSAQSRAVWWGSVPEWVREKSLQHQDIPPQTSWDPGCPQTKRDKEQCRFTSLWWSTAKSQARRASTLQTSAEREGDGGQLEKCDVANQEAKTFTNDVLVEVFFFFFGLSLHGHFIVPFLRTWLETLQSQC